MGDDNPGQPVFVDRTGRRRRLAVFGGTGIAAGLVAWLGLLLSGLVTGGPLPLPGWPEAGPRPQQNRAEAKREVRPSPTAVRAPAPATVPSAVTTPTVRPSAPVARPSAKAAGNRGLGDERRRTPTQRAKPSKSPGKPN
ncbi:hypothetical protein [Micromonospora pattaloongensis]|uniref:hypothetical protein n=1 Tax=Micromonospora pattaloongensis TaxID=405436 RepID=UPI000B809E61|nr:hypothetical protein [Micromonospora pattaloongensis]